MKPGLIGDLFAGGGGASVGIEAAFGRAVDFAINHDPVALEVHKANHPKTKHLTVSIWDAKPKKVTHGRHLMFLWASPDCTHFSVAKGGKPRKQNIRSLAHAVVEWARDVRPDVIMLENVQEFVGWGPLDSEGHPIKARMGETFQLWKGRLELLGYKVDHRILDASLYGAPTRRRRLFLIARCDGEPIVWPEATHGPGKLPVHTAAECIDWSLPCPSIFERERPLADKTLWRIAQGIKKFVLENPRPFIVGTGGPEYAGGPADTDVPLGTVLQRSHRAVVVPVIAGAGGRAGQSSPTSGDAPIGTVTAKNDRGLVTPTLVKVNHGKREARGEAIDAPLSTVTATQRGHGLVSPVMVRTDMHRSNAGCHYPPEDPLRTITSANGHAVVAPVLATIDHRRSQHAVGPAEEPLRTTTSKNRHAVIAPVLARTAHGDVDRKGKRRGQGSHSVAEPIGTVMAGGTDFGVIAPTLVQTSYGERKGQRPRYLDLHQPLGTVVAQGQKHALVAAFLNKHYGDPKRSDGGGGTVLGSELNQPIGTVTARDHHTVTAAHLVKLRGENHGAAADEPVPTITAGGGKGGRHIAEVRAFLTAYYGSDGTTGQALDEPTRTITARHRLGLVTVEGVDYQIVDIGFRMLEPHELLRAQFGRFATDYDLSAAKTKRDQVRLIGNSVCPELVEQLVRANLPKRARRAA